MPSNPPAEPKIYYITHIDNLRSIIDSGYLYSDANRINMGLISKNIGMSTIKERRLNSCLVDCYPGTTVGQYVPFYFCPRSIMLYIINQANHPDLAYKGRQRPIVHLQIDMYGAINWAANRGIQWAFSDCNASASYASFYNNVEYLDRVNWEAVAATQWSSPELKDGKQAEFLIYNYVPWELVERIGVIDKPHADQVASIVASSNPMPEIAVKPAWYY